VNKFILTILTLLPTLAHAQVNLIEKDNSFMLDNDKINIEISKNGDVTSLYKDGINMVKNLKGVSRDPNHNRSFYLDYHTGVSGGATNFTPSRYKIVEQSGDKVHLAFYGTNQDHVYLEYHYILKSNVSGIYSYVIGENRSGKEMRIAELRTVYRFDRDIMPLLFNGSRTSHPESYATLEAQPFIQDETWQLANGEVYTKYDLSNYMRDSQLWGVLGDNVGAWVVPASHDYFSGDDLNQELMVHQDAIALNYLTGAHMGTPDMFAPANWKKMYGPWLVYINSGKTPEELLDNAKLQVDTEVKQWPYKWVKESLYNHNRGKLTGKVGTALPVKVVLSSDLNSEFSQQTLGYFYSSETNNNGEYQLSNINPGKYQLSVYALAGTQIGTLHTETIEIKRGENHLDLKLPQVNLKPIWKIGEANRLSNEFKFSAQQRNYRWHKEVPANLNFIVGESNQKQDWYYAQTKPGVWTIKFELDKDEINDSVLNIALAAASNSGMSNTTKPQLKVTVNNSHITTISDLKNDKAIYRSALNSGRYHAYSFDIKKAILNKGTNSVQLELKGGAFMYDTINLVQ